MGRPPAAERPARFHGWRMVEVAFLVDFIAVGFFFYSFGVFYPVIDADFPGASARIAAGIAVSNLMSGVAAPFIGLALDRFPIKRVMLTGALVVSAGFALLSRTTAVWQYYLVLGTFFSVGLGMMGGLASAKLVANWFILRRGTAFGRATMGVSLSGLVMPSIATWLVAQLGWRGGFLVYAVGILVIVVPVVALFVVSRPEDLGLHPDGARAALRDGDDPERSWSARALLGTRDFWVIALPFALVFSSLSSILIHLVPYASDLGLSGYRAAQLLSLAAGSGAVGKLIFGQLVDRVDPRIAVWLSFGSQLAGLGLLMQTASYGGLALGALVFGFGMGGVIPLQGAVTGLVFGRRNFGSVAGLMRPVQVPIHAVGIPLAAWIHDRTGSFDLAWQIFLGVYLVGCVMIASLRVAPRRAHADAASERQPGAA